MTPDEVLRRLTFLTAEVAALMAWVAQEMGADAAGLPAVSFNAAPAAAPAAPVRKLRWRYVPGTWYRIVDANPFREGNNYNLFEYLAKRYGEQAFSREDLAEAIQFLQSNDRISSVQSEDQIVLVFLRTAGAEKNAVAMTKAPAEGHSAPLASESEALPPEPGDITYRLLGDMPFRSGVNVHIWKAMGNKPFLRHEIIEEVRKLVDSGLFESIRPPETIVRDFLGRVQEKGRLERT